MREIRVYVEQEIAVNQSVSLDAGAARHLTTVLRVKPGQPVTLFNGKGGEYRGVVTDCSGKTLITKPVEFIADDRESHLQVILGIGLSRGERMDWAVQKATELGVTVIAPLFTERTEVKLNGERADKRRRHWRQVIISACEQSGRNRLPEILPPQPLASWLSEQSGTHKFVLHHRSDQSLSAEAPADGRTTLLIGPEGGLSEDEVAQAVSCKFRPLTLGPRVMRTETAPVAAISILQMFWGDFGRTTPGA